MVVEQTRAEIRYLECKPNLTSVERFEVSVDRGGRKADFLLEELAEKGIVSPGLMVINMAHSVINHANDTGTLYGEQEDLPERRTQAREFFELLAGNTIGRRFETYAASANCRSLTGFRGYAVFLSEIIKDFRGGKFDLNQGRTALLEQDDNGHNLGGVELPEQKDFLRKNSLRLLAGELVGMNEAVTKYLAEHKTDAQTTDYLQSAQAYLETGLTNLLTWEEGTTAPADQKTMTEISALITARILGTYDKRNKIDPALVKETQKWAKRFEYSGGSEFAGLGIQQLPDNLASLPANELDVLAQRQLQEVQHQRGLLEETAKMVQASKNGVPSVSLFTKRVTMSGDEFTDTFLTTSSEGKLQFNPAYQDKLEKEARELRQKFPQDQYSQKALLTYEISLGLMPYLQRKIMGNGEIVLEVDDLVAVAKKAGLGGLAAKKAGHLAPSDLDLLPKIGSEISPIDPSTMPGIKAQVEALEQRYQALTGASVESSGPQLASLITEIDGIKQGLNSSIEGNLKVLADAQFGKWDWIRGWLEKTGRSGLIASQA